MATAQMLPSIALPPRQPWPSLSTGMLITPPPEADDLEGKKGMFDDALPHIATQYPVPSIVVESYNPEADTVAVIGVGYVGLQLVEAFSTAYKVIAFDLSERRVQELREQYNVDSIDFTTDQSRLAHASHYLIAVSTILTPDGQVDTSCIMSAIDSISKYARPGATVVIESSVAVGMTRELLQPLMRIKGLRCGMSPERVDPGRTFPLFQTIPKLVSGLDPDSLFAIQTLYGRVFSNLVSVSNPEVAEMTKLYENCQRMMCIAYANEMADACHAWSHNSSSKASLAEEPADPVTIDPYEVVRAAATKPFGYMPYQPSLGVGGHCIPVNPYYLLVNNQFPLLQACAERMRDRPSRIGDRVMAELSARGPITARQHKQPPAILVVGLGFKKGQSVMSHSPGRALAVRLLDAYDVHVEFADPLVEPEAVKFMPRLDHRRDWNVEYLRRFDAIVVAVEQPGLDLQVLREAEQAGVSVHWFIAT